MKQRGFTLIELIAAVGLLGMLATIIITVSVRKINETKEYSRDTMIDSIELAAQNYVIDNKDELIDFNKNDYIYVTLQTLVEKEYFKNSLINPITDKSLPLSDTVYVIREINGKLKAIYDIDQREKARLVLNGPYNQYVKKGSEFIDLGVSATSKDGVDILNDITINQTVDTSTVGTYKVTYKYDDIIVTRNVIIYE